MQTKRAGIPGNPESSNHPARHSDKSVEILKNPLALYQGHTMKARKGGGVGAKEHSTMASKAGKE